MRIWITCLVLAAGCRWGFGARGDDQPPGDSPPPGDGNGSGTADAPRDGVMANSDAPTPCLGTTHTVTDNFDDNTTSSTLWGNAYADTGASYAETGGRVELHLPANKANTWTGYVSTTVYELKDDRVFVEVPVVNASSVSDTVLLLWTSTAKTDGPSIEYEVGSLVMRRRVSNVIYDKASLQYSATTHRWWQIREHNGTTYWETSPDGVTWTTQYQEATTGATTALITLSAGTNNAASQTDVIAFDNFNGGGAPPSCP